MRSFITTLVLLLFANGIFVPSMQSFRNANPVGQIASAQSLQDAVKTNCCEETSGKMALGYDTCAMDCHFLVHTMVVGFRQDVAAKVVSRTNSLIFSFNESLTKPPISS